MADRGASILRGILCAIGVPARDRGSGLERGFRGSGGGLRMEGARRERYERERCVGGNTPAAENLPDGLLREDDHVEGGDPPLARVSRRPP
jgi:hypothetical protein